jgi:outer membrane receptor protein involved in Fe transport
MMHLDIDNGYDGWTLDNSRVSHSDFIGKDTQLTNAFSLKSTYEFGSKMKLISSLDWSDTDSLYAYDNDWTAAGDIIDDEVYINDFGETVNGIEQYISGDSYDRSRKNVSIDVRLVSDKDGKIFNGTTDWTVGVYHQDRKHTLHRFTDYYENNYWGPWDESTDLRTEYDTKSTALYGQLDSELNDKLTLITGLRVENWKANYSDNQIYTIYEPDYYAGEYPSSVNIDYDEVLYGGKIGLNYQQDEDTLMYMALSKGYKPGGVNIEVILGDEYKTYETEALWNLEAGINSSHFDNKLTSRLNFFYAKRKDQQIDTSVQIVEDFFEYISNAAKSHNYGVESELDYYHTDSLHLYSRIGLLQTEFDEHNYNEDDPYINNLEGREQAQSPNYQFNIGLNYNFMTNWRFNTNVEGKGSYYFSNSHNEKISSYAIGNAALSYAGDNWSVNLWVRNITDKDYAVKAYYFDNKISNPDVPLDDETYDYNWDQPEVFIQKGAPRTFGLTIAYDF